jgi:hypothetical protein
LPARITDPYGSSMSSATLIADEVARTEQRHGRRRVVIGVLIAVLVLAAAGFGIGFWRYAASYAPLQMGDFGGPYGSGAPNFREVVTDLGDEIYVAGPTGAEAGYLLELVNDGSHAVTVTGYERVPAVTGVRWSRYVLNPGDSVFGARLPLRSLPAQIAPHQSIKIVFELQHPKCDGNRGYGTLTYVPLRWTALGVHHIFDMPLGDPATTFVPCPQYLPVKPVRRTHH